MIEETEINYHLTIIIEEDHGIYYIKHVDTLHDISVDIYASYGEEDAKRFYKGYIALFPKLV